MQVDPIKPKLELPGTKPLKLTCDEPLSMFAFKFKLRRYTEVGDVAYHDIEKYKQETVAAIYLAEEAAAEAAAGKQAGARHPSTSQLNLSRSCH